MLLVKLDVINYNLEYIKNITNKKIIIVIKSNAYGIGAKYLVAFYEKMGIEYFFVNHYEEFKAISTLIKKSKVIIMDSITLKNDENIIYTINSYNDALHMVNTKKRITVHLQIDIGMNRLGIKSKDEFKKIISLLKTNSLIDIEGIYAHFPLSLTNINDYNALTNVFLSYLQLYHFKIIHTCATPSLHKTIIGNYLRVGLAIYGLGNPFIKLKFALAAYEKPIAVYQLGAGEKVGYESINNKIMEPSRVAVMPIGYYEVFNLDYIVNNHQKYQKIGNSCMNHSHFIVDDKITELTYLSILRKNDIIDIEKINPYHYLINLANYRKIYIMRYQNDIFRINKKKYQSCNRIKFRINSCKNFSPRIIRL